jgi:hypothetical protein
MQVNPRSKYVRTSRWREETERKRRETRKDSTKSKVPRTPPRHTSSTGPKARVPDPRARAVPRALSPLPLGTNFQQLRPLCAERVPRSPSCHFLSAQTQNRPFWRKIAQVRILSFQGQMTTMPLISFCLYIAMVMHTKPYPSFATFLILI